MRRDTFGNDAACAHDGPFANRNPTEDRRARSNRSPALDHRRFTTPVDLRLQLASRRRSRKPVVDERHIVTNEHLVFDRDAFTNESMTAHFAAAADPGPLLHFHERPDLRLVTNLATVKICERKDPHPL